MSEGLDRFAVSWRDQGLWRSRNNLERLLGGRIDVLPPRARPLPQARAVVGWGRRPSGERARYLAQRHGLACWRIEDAFLRSLALGDTPPYGIVIDDLGIYYDAGERSRLEAHVQVALTEERNERARALMRQWRIGRVSKYNLARERQGICERPYVLVVDQTAGDASIRFGQADPASFTRMLEAALDEHPSLPILLKVHPDVVAGRKSGHFKALTPGQAARVRVCADDVHAPALIEPASVVYTVTSQMGFEGLLWGKPVRVFGMPFYAGWGLTQDERPAPERRSPAPLEALVHAALVDYGRYLDPETGERCEVERLLEWMALQRRMRQRFAGEVHAIAFSRWKKPIVRAFFGGSQVRFVRHSRQVPEGATVAVWGGQAAPHQARDVVRLEDGFLRSVGLGADLVRPLSWVMDRSGMYYDATVPSDLETLLREARFDDALVARARRLRQRIVAQGITKYNVGTGGWQRPEQARRVVLVPGQVESDAAIARGATRVATNIGLLRAVREAAPDAYVVYKPHPDVVARLRREGQGEDAAAEYCDEVVVDAPMYMMLEAVDEVHVMTSLAGFEALLRGRRVATYGRPFYAGWGLTQDHDPPQRRGRKLDLDELVAAVLILYPTYVSRRSGAFTTPEHALEELQEWRVEGASQAGAWLRLKRALLRWFSPVARR
ncbi:MAG TPA: capsular polysaccharide biosynthesis protein [Burkholderiaceae bacterium]|nr:capsular polysaccharide biosynthesis protein [Burkholderiaceae bacterium]